MPFLYNISISFYYLFILIASIFNKKAQKWIKGRKGIFRIIENDIDKESQIAWFHSASLGEFEQGKPVIDKLKEKYPEFKIILTFFSPSGYEIKKDYENADYVYYLPIDSKRNAKRFLNIINPKIAFFIKYEFWFNYLNELSKNNVPSIVFSSNFRKNQVFFKWYGKWYKEILKKFHSIFVQNQTSVELLKEHNIDNVHLAGDTRFERVIEIADKSEDIKEIEIFKQNNKIIIAGSSWEKDEEIICKFINSNNSNLKFIIAPHEVKKQHIAKIKSKLKIEFVCLSEANENSLINSKCLIIDSIGMLSRIYKYCDIAFIGGGFGKGIHNILEAAVHGMPIIFGPNYQKFNEAKELIKLEGAKSISSFEEFNNWIKNILEDKSLHNTISKNSLEFVKKSDGAVQMILSEVDTILK